MIRVIIRRWGRFEGISKDREKGPKPWSNQVAFPPQKNSTRESKWCVLRIAGKEEAPVCEGAEVWEDHVQAFPRSQLEAGKFGGRSPLYPKWKYRRIDFLTSAKLHFNGVGSKREKRGVRSDKIIFRRYCTVCTAQGPSDPAANGRPMRNL